MGFVYSKEQASIWPSWARSDSDSRRNQTAGFFSQQLQSAWLAWSCRDWWHQTCPPFNTRKEDVTDSSIPCCLLSRPPAGNLHTSPSKTREEISFAESKCADTGTNDWHSSKKCQKRRDCVLCCKPLGSFPHGVGLLKRLFLPKVKHYLQAAPTLISFIKRIEEAFCLPREVIFGNKM